MTESILFSVLRQFNSPRSKAGRVWRINLISGELNIGSRICLRDVTISSNKRTAGPVFATIKQMQKEVGYNDVEFIDVARSGDLVSINLKDCVFGCGRIDKSEINIGKSTIGLAYKEEVQYLKDVVLNILHDDRVDLLRAGQEVSLLWLGNSLPSKIKAISSPQLSVNALHVKLELSLNGEQKIALPLARDLEPYCSKFIVKLNENLCSQPYLLGDLNRTVSI